MRCKFCNKKIRKYDMQQHCFNHGIDFCMDKLEPHIKRISKKGLISKNAYDLIIDEYLKDDI